MNLAQISHPAQRAIRLMSVRSTKRWGRWLMFAWFVMWVSTVLLPCSEVEAAIAAHEQATHSGCAQSASKRSDTGGSKKHKPCSTIATPTQASAARPAATGGSQLPLMTMVSASSYVLAFHPGLSLPVAYRAAPPPVAVTLRSLRLLI